MLLLIACERIDDGLDPEIDDEDPMNQNDDNTTPEELFHHFDLQKSLKKLYDPKHSYNVRSRIVLPEERIEKKRPPKKITLAFEKQEDKEMFTRQRENKDHEVNDNKGDRETDETEDETFKILMYDDVPLTSDTSE